MLDGFYMKLKVIAILGGTFDPIHTAHLKLAESLDRSLNCQEILFIPCKQNPLKHVVNVSSEQRIAMIQLAIQNNSHYRCDLRELEQIHTPLYTLETFQSLRRDYPDASIVFALGNDSLNTLDQWPGFEEYLHYVHFMVFSREGFVFKPSTILLDWIQKVKTVELTNLHDKKQGCLYFADTLKMDVSSTQIRAYLRDPARQAEAKNLLPTAVFNFIEEHELYGYVRECGNPG